MIEASSDLFSFDHTGRSQAQKAELFVRSYFNRCSKQFNCFNEVTIIIYGRLYYPQISTKRDLKEVLEKLLDTSSVSSNEIN